MNNAEIEKLIPILNALVYYSQISTVENVRPAGMLRHETAWRDGQEWLWRNCDIVDGEYKFSTDAMPREEWFIAYGADGSGEVYDRVDKEAYNAALADWNSRQKKNTQTLRSSK